jgi:hypothetical protein
MTLPGFVSRDLQRNGEKTLLIIAQIGANQGFELFGGCHLLLYLIRCKLMDAQNSIYINIKSQIGKSNVFFGFVVYPYLLLKGCRAILLLVDRLLLKSNFSFYMHYSIGSERTSEAPLPAANCTWSAAGRSRASQVIRFPSLVAQQFIIFAGILPTSTNHYSSQS